MDSVKQFFELDFLSGKLYSLSISEFICLPRTLVLIGEDVPFKAETTTKLNGFHFYTYVYIDQIYTLFS